MLIGESGSGKTEMIRVIEDALNELGNRIISTRINPKAVSIESLFGYFNFAEWNYGVLSGCLKKCIEEDYDPNTKHWIILDGAVDT